MPSARSRSTARTPCLPAPMEAEGTGLSSLHSSRPANSMASIRKPISQTSSRASQACRAQNLHPYPAGPPCRKPSSIRRLWPLNTFAENSRLYSPAFARLTPLTMVETGLPSFSNCQFRAIRWVPQPECSISSD